MKLVFKSDISIKFTIITRYCDLQKILTDLNIKEIVLSQIEITIDDHQYLIVNYENSTIVIYTKTSISFLEKRKQSKREFDYYIHCFGDNEIMKMNNEKLKTKITSYENSINKHLWKYFTGFYNFVIFNNNKVHDDLFVKDFTKLKNGYNKDYYSLLPLNNKIQTINKILSFNILQTSIIGHLINKKNNNEVQSIICKKINNLDSINSMVSFFEISIPSSMNNIKKHCKIQILIESSLRNNSIKIIKRKIHVINDNFTRLSSSFNRIYTYVSYHLWMPFNFQIYSDETKSIKLNTVKAWKSFESQIVNNKLNTLKILSICELMIKFSDLNFEIFSKWMNNNSKYDFNVLLKSGIETTNQYSKKSVDNCLNCIKEKINSFNDLTTNDILNKKLFKEFFNKISFDTRKYLINDFVGNISKYKIIKKIIKKTYMYCKRI